MTRTTLSPSTGRVGTVRGAGLSATSAPILDMNEAQLREAIRRLFAGRIVGGGEVAPLGALTEDLSHHVERAADGTVAYALAARGTFASFLFRLPSPRQARAVGRMILAYADELGRLQDEAAKANPLPWEHQP